MSEYLYPLSTPALFVIYPDSKPVIKQPLSNREKEFKALPVWAEKVFEDWALDRLPKGAGFGDVDVQKPDDVSKWVRNQELDARIKRANQQIEALLIEEGKVEKRDFDLSDAFGKLPPEKVRLGESGDDSVLALESQIALQEPMLDLQKRLLEVQITRTSVNLTKNVADLSAGVLGTLDWMATVTASGEVVAASPVAGAASVAGTIAGVVAVAAIAASLAMDTYANSKAKEAVRSITGNFRRLYDSQLKEVESMIGKTFDDLHEVLDGMESDIEAKVTERKDEMRQAVIQARTTGHGVFATRGFTLEDPGGESPGQKAKRKKKAQGAMAALAVAVAAALTREVAA